MKITMVVALIVGLLSAGASWKLTSRTVTAEWSAKYATLAKEHAEQGQELAEKNLKLAELRRNRARERQARIDELAAVTALESDLIRKNERIALLEAAAYEPPDTTCNCDLNAEWVRLYNAAARLSGAGADTEAAGRTANTARNLKDALNVTAQNFADCARWRTQLIGWQRYNDALNVNR